MGLEGPVGEAFQAGAGVHEHGVIGHKQWKAGDRSEGWTWRRVESKIA